MDPISIAFGLAQFAPKAIKWLTGSDKAEEAATTIVNIAKTVTGQDSGPDALAAMTTNPNLALQFRQAVLAQEAELDKAFLADRQDARSRDVEYVKAGRNNRRADVMVGLAFTAIILITAMMVWGPVRGDSIVIGFLSTIGGMFARNIGSAFDFEFGSSRGSAEKSKEVAEVNKVMQTMLAGRRHLPVVEPDDGITR